MGPNYDRTLADLLALQGELATEIAVARRDAQSTGESGQSEAHDNPAGYDAYLRGRAFVQEVGADHYHEGDPTRRSVISRGSKLDLDFVLPGTPFDWELFSYWSGSIKARYTWRRCRVRSIARWGSTEPAGSSHCSWRLPR